MVWLESLAFCVAWRKAWISLPTLNNSFLILGLDCCWEDVENASHIAAYLVSRKIQHLWSCKNLKRRNSLRSSNIHPTLYQSYYRQKQPVCWKWPLSLTDIKKHLIMLFPLIFALETSIYSLQSSLAWKRTVGALFCTRTLLQGTILVALYHEECTHSATVSSTRVPEASG